MSLGTRPSNLLSMWLINMSSHWEGQPSGRVSGWMGSGTKATLLSASHPADMGLTGDVLRDSPPTASNSFGFKA